jgi:hypothetical protein
MKRSIVLVLTPLAVVIGMAALALVFGGPSEPPPMPSINNPFKDVDFSDLPAISRYPARDGASLAFRAYPAAGGWVRVGIPRLVVISMLNRIGVHSFNGLTILRFALDQKAKAFLTAQYSFALSRNFQPQRDYRANLRAVGQPLSLMAGLDDEAFHADRFAGVFQAEGKDVPVTLLPGIGHIGLTLDPLAVRTAVELVVRMDRPKG